MNYIKHLTGFFERVVSDDRLNATHISLYMSLFQYWNVNRFKNPISISRSEIMRISKISAKGTYHKCMRELHGWGFVVYKPSYNPFKGSLVHLLDFSEPGTEQAPVSSINYLNFENAISGIEKFFSEKGQSIAEARKFFNHYQSVGWKLAGQPILDWKALAEKWMITSAGFRNTRAASRHQVNNEKNYNEAL